MRQIAQMQLTHLSSSFTFLTHLPSDTVGISRRRPVQHNLQALTAL